MRLRFDRGTILVADPPRQLDLAKAPGVRWDPRVGAFQDLAPPLRLVEEAWSDVDLRPYQEAALSAWELGHRRGVVALPTGSGKTRLALAAMHRTRLAALCLVPTRVLLDQWLREIGGVYRSAVGCMATVCGGWRR